LYRNYSSTLSPATFLPTLIALEWSTQIEPPMDGETAYADDVIEKTYAVGTGFAS